MLCVLVICEAVEQNFLQLCSCLSKFLSLLDPCPSKSRLIGESWLKTATLIINYWNKALRKVGVPLLQQQQPCRDVAVCNLSPGWMVARFQQGAPAEHPVRGKY